VFFVVGYPDHVKQSGERKLTYIMIVAIRKLCAEYGHCPGQQTYENVLNNAVKVTNGV
jgi:hypothetical protein